MSVNSKKPLIIVLLAILMALGSGASYWQGDRLEKTAHDFWLAKGRLDATRMTENIVFWAAKAEVNLRAIAGQLRGQKSLNPIIFRDLIDDSKTWDPDVSFASVAYARRVPRHLRKTYEKDQAAFLSIVGQPDKRAADAYESYAIYYSTVEQGILQRHSDLMSHPSMENVVKTARQLPGDVILGPSFVGENDHHFALIATSADLGGDAGVMVATVNLSEFFTNLSANYLPDNIRVRLLERDNEALAERQLTSDIGPVAPPSGTVATEIIRVTMGQAKWDLHWDIMPGYQGGPADQSGALIKIGGSLLTLLIVLTVGFLAFRNMQFHSLVQQRTAQLSENSLIIQLTMDSIDQGFSVWSADHELVVWSQRCLSFWYEPGEIVRKGMHMKELLAHLVEKKAFGDGDPTMLIEQEYERIASAGTMSEDTFDMFDGRTVYVRRFSLERGGHVGVYTDVTGRIQADKEIQESVDRYRELSDLSSDWVWEMDADLRLSYFSIGFKNINGIDSRFAIGKTRQELTSDSLESDHWKTYLEKLRDRQDFKQFRYTFVGPDGIEQQHSVSGKPIFDEAGVFTGYRGTSSNVSNLFLARELLQTAKESAEQANRAKTGFLSSMSHELRTPLNAILGFGQMLKMNPAEPLTENQISAVDNINKGGAHLLNLVGDILDLSKIEAGEIDLLLEPVSPHDVFSDCLELSHGLADSKQITLIKEEGSTSAINVDYNRLKQTILNLMTNAIKYNKDGGSVTYGCMDRPKNILRIYMTDTGIGISDDDKTNLFTSFNRLGMEASEIEGTGIGLTISKNLVERMGGKIGCDSEVGKGSTFWLDFPISQGASPKGRKKGVERNKRQSLVQTRNVSGSILYIEDNPINRELMETIVGSIGGLTLRTAGSAEIGIEMAEQFAPDLILMDINLPGMNGNEALGVLRDNPPTHHIPVIAVSANAMPEDIQSALDLGFEEYVIKPFDISDVIATIMDQLPQNSTPVDIDAGDVSKMDDETGPDGGFSAQYAPLNGADIERIHAAAQMLPASYVAVLKNQVASLQTVMAEVRQACEAGNLNEAEALAHNLKTNSATFGARDVWALAQAIEELAGEEKTDGLSELLDNLERELEKVLPTIQRLLSELPVPPE